MDQLRLAKQRKTIDQLLCKYAHKCGRQSSELILLDQFVQVNAEQLENETEMLPMNEGVLQSEQMVVVVLVHLLVQLFPCQHAFPQLSMCLTRSSTETSIILWLKYAVLFLITFTATTS